MANHSVKRPHLVHSNDTLVTSWQVGGTGWDTSGRDSGDRSHGVEFQFHCSWVWNEVVLLLQVIIICMRNTEYSTVYTALESTIYNWWISPHACRWKPRQLKNAVCWTTTKVNSGTWAGILNCNIIHRENRLNISFHTYSSKLCTTTILALWMLHPAGKNHLSSSAIHWALRVFPSRLACKLEYLIRWLLWYVSPWGVTMIPMIPITPMYLWHQHQQETTWREVYLFEKEKGTKPTYSSKKFNISCKAYKYAVPWPKAKQW